MKTKIRLRAIPRNIVVEESFWVKAEGDKPGRYTDWTVEGYYANINAALIGAFNAGIVGDDVKDLRKAVDDALAAVRALSAALPLSVKEDLARILDSDERNAERGARIAKKNREAKSA